jgi:hypothetical protein
VEGDTEADEVVGSAGPISKPISPTTGSRARTVFNCDDSPESDAEVEEVVASANEEPTLYNVHRTIIEVIDKLKQRSLKYAWAVCKSARAHDSTRHAATELTIVALEQMQLASVL